MVRHPGLNDLIASDGIPTAEVASARYILALFGGGAGISVTPLQLLDPDQNRALAADFAVYVVGDSMDRALGRATAFMRHKLYGDAAIEYEAALALEPEFPELVAKLIDTHRAYGNESRARELVARITRPR